MKIRKGDMLHQCNSNDIPDKDYCNDELLDRLTVQGPDCSSDDFDHGAYPNLSKWRNLKSYISLRDRVKRKLNEIAIHKMMKW